MLVRDLLEILNRLDPHQKLRVVMAGSHTGEAGPTCCFSDSEPPAVAPDEDGVIELHFADDKL